MESFEAFKKYETEPSIDIAEPTAKTESRSDSVLVETNQALRSLVTDLGTIDKGIDRVPVFKRMFAGPEVVTDDPALLPFFNKISAIEDKYGREAVIEIARLYGADRV